MLQQTLAIAVNITRVSLVAMMIKTRGRDAKSDRPARVRTATSKKISTTEPTCAKMNGRVKNFIYLVRLCSILVQDILCLDKLSVITSEFIYLESAVTFR